ncbi:MAG TPA: hypothetical protein VF064_01175 [Pyrinomonadaceae bacterium]
MVEVLETFGAAALALFLLYFYLKGLIQSVRELRETRYPRILMYGLLAASGLTVGSCLIVERTTGISPYADPPSFAVRQWALGALIAGYVALFWRFTPRHVDARAVFATGRLCPKCGRALQQKRLHYATLEANDTAPPRHWLHRCECGEWTLFHPDGRATHAEDRTNGRGPD